MKRISIIAASFVFMVLFSVAAFAQTGAAPPAAAGKIGLVNTLAFAEDKPGAGITKYKNALKTVDDEFKVLNDELRTLATKYQALEAEIKKMQNDANNPAVPMKITPEMIQTKVDEYQNLELQIKRKQEDGKARYERRYQVVVGPIYNDILKAMSEYAKQKGYAVILDGARLEQAEILLGFDEKYNITNEFITFYNTRPATTATTAVPK